MRWLRKKNIYADGFHGEKNFSRTYLTFNDFVHVCQGKKNYMIRGLGKKINYRYPPPPPPPSQKWNGWPLMSATVKWLATIEWCWLGYELQNFSYPTKAEFNIVLLFLQNDSKFKNKLIDANLSQFKFSLRGIMWKTKIHWEKLD